MTVPPPPDPLGPPTPPYGMAVPYPDAAWPAAAPPYPGPYPYPPYPYPPRRTNAMAIASLVCAFVFAPLAILFGHLSLSQIKRSGEEGRGMAIAGLVIGYVVTVGTVLMLVAGVLFFSWAAKVVRESPEFRGGARHSAAPPGDGSLPPFRPPAGLGACSYPPTATAAVKPVKPPRVGAVPTDPAVVDATLTFKDGTTEDVVVGLRLDNAKAPCTVNSFVSLAEQRFFDNTGCHRLTDSPSLAVLQCGDPTGSGAGGPGYRFANEYPTNQYRPFDPALKMPVTYPRGTLAMANSGPDSNGSQFFITYRDSELPPTYTVFGGVDKIGMAAVDELVSAGVADGGQEPSDGKPKSPITVKSVRLD